MPRLWEIDTLRGVAIAMMLLSNLLFDLHLFAGCQDCYAGLWVPFARVTAGLFVLLAGVALTLSAARGKSTRGFVLRGLRILGYGLIVTAISWVVFPSAFIVFGILHLIGAGIILSLPFLRRPAASLVAGMVVIGLGLWVSGLSVETPWLVWLGLEPVGFATVDYTPLLPWWGIMLVGVALGNLLFPKGKPRFPLPDMSKNPLIQLLALAGRRSLLIYLIHQPIFVGILFALGIATF